MTSITSFARRNIIGLDHSIIAWSTHIRLATPGRVTLNTRNTTERSGLSNNLIPIPTRKNPMPLPRLVIAITAMTHSVIGDNITANTRPDTPCLLSLSSAVTITPPSPVRSSPELTLLIASSYATRTTSITPRQPVAISQRLRHLQGCAQSTQAIPPMMLVRLLQQVTMLHYAQPRTTYPAPCQKPYTASKEIPR